MTFQAAKAALLAHFLPGFKVVIAAAAGAARLAVHHQRAARSLRELAALAQGAERLQRLVLDLPNALTCHVERPSDFVERLRRLAVESVPQLEHPPLAVRDQSQNPSQSVVAERRLDRLV